MRFQAWVAALALSGCAFSSEAPLFGPEQAAFPIADGARYDWIEPFVNGERFEVTFRRVEGGYELIEAEHPGEPMAVRFIAITETPQDDYIVQADMEPGEGGGYAYAFVWGGGEIYRVISDPGTVELGPKRLQRAESYCEWRSYGECSLGSAEDALALYRALLYPRFVAGDDLPGRYSELVPVARRLPRGTMK